MNKGIALTTSLLLSGTLLSPLAWAHFPTLGCQKLDAEHLHCTAGYSDGSLAGKVQLKVFSYDEKLLASYDTATDGSAKVKIPTGEYFIVFDPGHESPAEFDYVEIQ